MEDPDFRVRLLQWIVNLVCEKMPNTVVDETHGELGFQVFQPYPVPSDLAFNQIRDFHVYIVCSRQMHSEKHTPTCFKYSTTQCHMRYPRRLVA